MSPDEGKDDVEKILPDETGKIPANKEGKYPEVIPWSQYVGIKESLGKKLDVERERVTSLEERLKTAINAEEHSKVKQELDDTKTKLQETSDELKGVKDKSASELREHLKTKGVSEEELKEMSEKELRTVAKAVDSYKPKPDLGGGGGGGVLVGGPMELARQAYGAKT